MNTTTEIFQGIKQVLQLGIQHTLRVAIDTKTSKEK